MNLLLLEQVEADLVVFEQFLEVRHGEPSCHSLRVR